MIRVIAALSLLVAAAPLVSCASLDRPAPERGYFVIDPGRPASAPGASSAVVEDGPTLKVGPWRVSPRFARQDFVYRVGDEQYAPDYYNFHLIDPGRMLSDAARSWFDASGRFAAVVDGGSQAPADFELDGLVTELYGDLRDPAAPRAVVGVRLFLIDRRSADWKVSRTLELRREIATEERSAAALARAWGRGFREILAEAEALVPPEVAKPPITASATP